MSARRITAATAGAAMAAVGIFVNAAMWERALLGAADGSLSWGPTLFRILLVVHGATLIAFALRPRKRPSKGLRLIELSSGEALGLVALTLLALLLRLWKLNGGLWIDEVFTLVDYVRAGWGEVLTRFPSQNQHMLYSLSAKAAVALGGERPAMLRLPAALFGAATVLPLYLLGRRLLGRHEAWIAAALLTVSYHHVWFSQSARGYSGLLFFSVAATWLWLEAREHGGRRRWTAYVVGLVLGLWIHMTMLFVVASHGIAWLLSAARARRSPLFDSALAAWIVAGTASAQLYAFALPEFIGGALHESSMNSEWTNPLWLILETARGLQVGFSGGAIVLLGGATLFAGWVGLARRSLEAAVVFTLPGLLGAALIIGMGHNIWPRFFFFTLGFGLLVAVHGALLLPRIAERTGLLSSVWARRVGQAIAAVLIVSSVASLPRCYALPKQDFLGAKAFVESNRAPDDVVVSVGLAARVYGSYFAPEWPAAQTLDELRAATPEGRPIWLLYTLPIEIRAFQPEVWRTIERDYEAARIFPGTLGQGEIYVCRRREDKR